MVNQTRPTAVLVEDFLAGVDERRQDDARELVRLMSQATGEPPAMWGPSIVGFGTYHYTYASGRQGDAPLVAFSPRKPATVLYMSTEPDVRSDILARLGPHTEGKGCVYVKRLSEVDPAVLVELIRATVEFSRNQDVSGRTGS